MISVLFSNAARARAGFQNNDICTVSFEFKGCCQFGNRIKIKLRIAYIIKYLLSVDNTLREFFLTLFKGLAEGFRIIFELNCTPDYLSPFSRVRSFVTFRSLITAMPLPSVPARIVPSGSSVSVITELLVIFVSA